MNDDILIARTISAQLGTGKPVALILIVDAKGSSPRRNGAKMVVKADGEALSTIGGGALEATSIDEGVALLKIGRSKIMEFGFRGKTADSLEMLCGGNAKLLLDVIQPDSQNVKYFDRYLENVENGKDFFTLTAISPDGEFIKVTGRYIFSRDGMLAGSPPLREQDVEELKSRLREVSTAELITLNGLTITADLVSRTKTLYCFGAGHVAMATAHLAALVGFEVTVIDDRDDYADIQRFPDAEKVIVVNDFASAMKDLPVNGDSFLVIVTRGHQHDGVVLEQALKTNAAYIGMIGSKRKREILYADLMTKGVSRKQLEKVHCPIGLPIKAETPEEIAVSIVSELILEKYGQHK